MFLSILRIVYFQNVPKTWLFINIRTDLKSSQRTRISREKNSRRPDPLRWPYVWSWFTCKHRLGLSSYSTWRCLRRHHATRRKKKCRHSHRFKTPPVYFHSPFSETSTQTQKTPVEIATCLCNLPTYGKISYIRHWFISHCL